MTTPSRRRRYSRMATISRIPAGNDPEAREVVVANVPCTAVHELDQEQKERADMGTVTAARLVYCPPQVVSIEKRMRLRLSGSTKEYAIHRVAGHPADAPAFLALYLEDEAP